MPSLDVLKRRILTECEEDHVGLWSVVRDAQELFSTTGEAVIRSQVLRLLRELLTTHEVKAGFPTKKGTFRSLRSTPERIMERIEAAWPIGRRPTIGEGVWFTKATKKPHQTLALAAVHERNRKRA